MGVGVGELLGEAWIKHARWPHFLWMVQRTSLDKSKVLQWLAFVVLATDTPSRVRTCAERCLIKVFGQSTTTAADPAMLARLAASTRPDVVAVAATVLAAFSARDTGNVLARYIDTLVRVMNPATPGLSAFCFAVFLPGQLWRQPPY